MMRSLQSIRASTPKSAFFRGQLQHLMLVILLIAGTGALLGDSTGNLWGIRAHGWAWASIVVAVVHQGMVALVWRLQLHFATMTRLFGDRALAIWGGMFLPFLLARPTLLLLAGLADAGTLGGNRNLQLIVGVLLLVFAGWAAYSVARYFTLPRALGGDHFTDEYLNMPMVTQGAFKYSTNAMYDFVFMGFWGIALLTGSWNAVVLALFQHAYIWVHMYCTEDPDMQLLYKTDQAGNTP